MSPPPCEQPVVFPGSEGETGVVAGSLSDFLRVLADGQGPREALSPDEEWTARPNDAPAGIAVRHATNPRRPASEIVAAAGAEFPFFAGDLGGPWR
ncbi:hypothetical protein [Streptomyces sp. NPDC001153]